VVLDPDVIVHNIKYWIDCIYDLSRRISEATSRIKVGVVNEAKHQQDGAADDEEIEVEEGKDEGLKKIVSASESNTTSTQTLENDKKGEAIENLAEQYRGLFRGV
jgi:hypothetical protein